MAEMSKIGPAHLRRDAYVYVRQSTMVQVRENTESLERQYELRERAVGLGWPASQVVVIDADLGRSGADATTRDGFQRLVAEVGLGHVGLVLGIEVSRLARNNADWYHLLDLCAVTDTLIADGDGLYHPGDYNDRLVLGLKGTMSEAELHLLRGRLNAGLRHKAAKGELRKGLPVGFDYDDSGAVVMSADEAVREAIATVFRRFEELGSARQALLSLIDDGLLMPHRRNGSKRVTWTKATYPTIHHFLTNPVYAGAFVFGRTRTDKVVDADGRLATRHRNVPREEWEVCIPDHHPGFVDWDTYLRIQDRLRSNWRVSSGEGGGPAREGGALLQGLLRCGQCSRIMQVAYSGRAGSAPNYRCYRGRQLYATTATCQTLGGRGVENHVLAEVFTVLEPANLTATIHALDQAEARHEQRVAAFELAAERARYEAERARRQFDAVEPENRLVARTLERAWEEALTEQRRAETDLATQRARRPLCLTDDEIEWLNRAGVDIRAIFEADTTTNRERKQLLRLLIDEIIITIDREPAVPIATATIIWQGGATTDLEIRMRRTGGRANHTDETTVDLIRRLAEHFDDTTIAQTLARQGRRTGTGLTFTRGRVASLRNNKGIARFDPENVTPPGEDVQVTSVCDAAKILDVSTHTIYRWLRDGFIHGEQLTPGAPWHIRIDNDLRDKLVPQVPDGWVGLNEAAATLRIARQTVLHRVQRGELAAVHVTHGKRKGLRIQVTPDQPGLFDQPQ